MKITRRIIAATLTALLLISTVPGSSMANAANPATVVFLVRHAEKAPEGEDPELSEAGHARAEQLAALLRDASVDTIYSTDFARTEATAAPLAERLGLTVQIYDWNELGALAAGMKDSGGRYLVVGHSDTTPELVTLLGGEAGNPIDEESEYDRLYIVTIAPGGDVATVLLRY